MGVDLGQIDRILTSAGENPGPASRVVCRWVESPEGSRRFARVCSTLGWPICRQVFELTAEGSDWGRIRACAPDSSSEAETESACRQFEADLQTEIAKGASFDFLRGLGRADLSTLLADLPPEKLSIVGTCLSAGILENAFSALPRELARKAAIGIARCARLPSEAIRRAAEPLAEELVGRVRELQRLRELVPPPPAQKADPRPEVDVQAESRLRAALDETRLGAHRRWLEFAHAESLELERILREMPQAEGQSPAAGNA